MQSFPRYLLALTMALLALPASAIDPPHNFGLTPGDCSVCHSLHSASGGALTIVEGNANLCQSCHMDGGVAQAFPFTEADQALPGPGLPAGVTASGFSHRWDSGPAGHVAPDAGNTSTGEVDSGGAFTGNFPKTYTITITLPGDAGVAEFSWADTRGGGASGVATGTDVTLDEGVTVTFTDGAGTPSFLIDDTWNIFVRTDLNLPTDITMAARIENGKIMCSTCHNVHDQDLTPFDPDAPAYGGSGTGEGRHYQRVDNDVNQMCADCHSARDVLSSAGGSHPVGVTIPVQAGFQPPGSLPLDALDQVACLTCHQIHFAPTTNGTLTRDADVTAMCEECHTLADPNASHLDAATGVLWPGGQYGTTFPENTDGSQRGFCINCHQPHGWPDTATPTQDYAKLLVEDASAGICFTCHDTDGPAGADIHGAFTETNCTTAPWGDCTVTGYQSQSLSSALINQRHDVARADQIYSSGGIDPPTTALGCANCHNPHLATSAEKLIHPNQASFPLTPYNQTYDYLNHGDETMNDPMNPIGCTPQAASIGPAVEGVHNGDDLGTSGGTFTDNEDQLYTVTISTGGAPPAAQITVTSLLGDNSGPTTVTAFNTPVDVGNRGVTISFTDGGSGGSPGSVGPAVDPAPANDDTAVSGGTYGGPASGTYTVTVTTGGRARDVVIECSGLDCGASTIVCQPTGAGGPQCAYDAPFDVGAQGVTITVSDAGARDFVAGDDWTIAVTAGGGDTVLTAGDTWTIAATAATAGCSTADEPDMVTFCLVCHSTNGGQSPTGVPGVVMSPNLINIGADYVSTDQHGHVDGTGGGNGKMKAPWQDVPGTDDGSSAGTVAGDGFADQELPAPYAALQCDTCHDGHGSPNLFHLRTQINVRGIQMSVGGGPGSGFQGVDIGGGVLRFTTVSDYGPGDTTYQLPCFSGASQVSCGDPGGEQRDHGWGAFCTFCHDMQTHGQSEDNDSCRTGHMHGGGAF